MTPETLRQIMKKEDLSVKDLATISGVTARQVIAWRQGDFPIPMTVAFLLLALDEGQLTQDWLVDALQSELREGV
jgi:transcriptional regulator with XRE-family HTH domain